MQSNKYHGVVVVCGEDEVERRSYEGYKLVEIVETDSLETVMERTTDHTNVYDPQPKESVERHFMTRKPRFVMVLDPESAVARLKEENETLSHRLRITDDVARKATDADLCRELGGVTVEGECT